MYIKLILIFFCLISLSKQHPGGHAGGEAREEIGKLKEGEEKDERGKNDTEKEKSKVIWSKPEENKKLTATIRWSFVGKSSPVRRDDGDDGQDQSDSR